MNALHCRRFAAWSGFCLVLFGAIGAHALKPILESTGSIERWHTAVFYQAIHTLVLLWIASSEPFRRLTAAAFIAGIILFSGGLYIYSLTAYPIARSITPFGGFAFLVGWLMLALGKSH